MNINIYRSLFAGGFFSLLMGFSSLAFADKQISMAPVYLNAGRSTLISLPEPISRVSVADPSVADVTVINPKEIYVLGKAVGSTNVILWDKAGQSVFKEIKVDINLQPLQEIIMKLAPNEKDISVMTSSGSVILSGSVANIIVSDTVNSLAEAFAQHLSVAFTSGQATPSGSQAAPSGAAAPVKTKVMNLLKIRDPQQVMLQVKIAEISKDYLEQLGVNLTGSIGGTGKFAISSAFVGTGLAGAAVNTGGSALGLYKTVNGATLNAEKDDTLFKVLAEPTIVAMSGQEGSFLVGGKIYIPQYGSVGTVTTLEVPYGIGLKCLPTVLDNGRINLKVAPEVSDVATSPLTLQGANAGQTIIIPRILTKSASTTVQIKEGQTLVIGGLISDTMTETVKAFPVLGEIPVLGALFRSKQFSSSKTELIVTITPVLVHSTDEAPLLPTDKFEPPARSDFFLGNDLENSEKAVEPAK